MSLEDSEFDSAKADDHVLELLARVIRQSHGTAVADDVARALLLFLVRVSNSWRSIRKLLDSQKDMESFTVDAATLLRAMYDAHIQAEYIIHDLDKSNERARDYLEFEHVERYKLVNSVMKHDTPLSSHLKMSPERPDGEKRLHEEYDRVKSRYLVKKRNKNDGSIRWGPRTRNTWHSVDLYKMAEAVEKDDEYDSLLKGLHGCVHSSAFAVGRGPMVSSEYVLHWASMVAARVARLNVNHHKIDLGESYRSVLNALCEPFL